MKEIRCPQNVNYAPGYITIKKVKINYANKTSIANCVNSVKNTARTALISNEGYHVNFIDFDAREEKKSISGYRAKNLSAPIKFFAALTAVTLLTGSSVHAQVFQMNGNVGGEERRDHFGTVNWEFDPNDSVSKGRRSAKESEIVIGSDIIKQSGSATASDNKKAEFTEIMGRGKLYFIEKNVINNLRDTYNDFDDTIIQFREAYQKSNPSRQAWLNDHINGLEKAKEVLLTLRNDFRDIAVSRNNSPKTKSGLLISKLKDFIDKNDNEGDILLVTMNMNSLCESLRISIKRLRAV